MATKLEKDVIRESIVEYDSRSIQVTLTKGQEISMKLKGMKSGAVSIPIEGLYKQLVGDDGESVKEAPKGSVVITNDEPKRKEKNWNNSPMINLYDLRSLSAIEAMDHDTKALFDKIINDVIRNAKK